MTQHGSIPLRLRRAVAAAIVAAALAGACGDVWTAVVAALDDRCCHDGICCCRPKSQSPGPCLRSICRCGGHDGDVALSGDGRSFLPTAPFQLLLLPIVGWDLLPGNPAPAAGHPGPHYRPPRVPLVTA